MVKRISLLKIALLGMALCSAPKVLAVEAFGSNYSAVAPVSSAQAQVVVFRPATSDSPNDAINVYVDRKFHTALLPGGFSTLCVAAGAHTLSASRHDAHSINLAGGLTYFLELDDDITQPSQFVRQDKAEQQLAGMRQQIQALSRASTVQTCNYQQEAVTALN